MTVPSANRTGIQRLVSKRQPHFSTTCSPTKLWLAPLSTKASNCTSPDMAYTINNDLLTSLWSYTSLALRLNRAVCSMRLPSSGSSSITDFGEERLITCFLTYLSRASGVEVAVERPLVESQLRQRPSFLHSVWGNSALGALPRHMRNI